MTQIPQCFLLKLKASHGIPVSSPWPPGMHCRTVWVLWHNGIFFSLLIYFYLLNLKTVSHPFESPSHSGTLFFHVHFSDMLENFMSLHFFSFWFVYMHYFFCSCLPEEHLPHHQCSPLISSLLLRVIVQAELTSHSSHLQYALYTLLS